MGQGTRTYSPAARSLASSPQQIGYLHKELTTVVLEAVLGRPSVQQRRISKVARVANVNRSARMSEIGDEHVAVESTRGCLRGQRRTGNCAVVLTDEAQRPLA